MNRICAAFSDIGKINLRIADVPPFNWQMLLSGPCDKMDMAACELFSDMDAINMSNIIESQDFDYASEREIKAGYELLASMIIEEIVEKFGSVESVYPSIAKYLFAGANMDKANHKQMFWRIFGDIAVRNLIANLSDCRICPDCGMKIPSWAVRHLCPSGKRGFFECVDCHKVYPRINPKQCRCESCQEEFGKSTKRTRNEQEYQKRKLAKELADKMRIERMITK